MPPAFFTTSDGDVILRAGTDPGPKYDFRVHKFILSLASHVFRDMLTFPQPPNQSGTEDPDIPVVDVADPPDVLDMVLRFIYPGVEPPKLTSVPPLSALLSAADKYCITSMVPALRDTLKTLLPDDSFGVYIVACRFGFFKEAKEAARVSTPSCLSNRSHEEGVRQMASTDLFRFARFVIWREELGRSRIEDYFELSSDGFGNSLGDCDDDHWDTAREFYSGLTKTIQDAFTHNPCLELKDLLVVLDEIPDPPLGCKPAQHPGDYYFGSGEYDAFSCPLQPMFIRRALADLAKALDIINITSLNDVFGRGD